MRIEGTAGVGRASRRRFCVHGCVFILLARSAGGSDLSNRLISTAQKELCVKIRKEFKHRMELDRVRAHMKKDFLVSDIGSSKCRCIPFDRYSVHTDIQGRTCSFQDFRHIFHKIEGVSFQTHPFHPPHRQHPFHPLIWAVKLDADGNS